MKDFRKMVPSPPAPSGADRASFAVYQAWFKRIRGVTFPEAEFRESNFSAPDGSVGKGHTPSRVPQAVIESAKKFTDIRAPALAIFADPMDYGPYAKNNERSCCARGTSDAGRL